MRMQDADQDLLATDWTSLPEPNIHSRDITTAKLGNPLFSAVVTSKGCSTNGRKSRTPCNI